MNKKKTKQVILVTWYLENKNGGGWQAGYLHSIETFGTFKKARAYAHKAENAKYHFKIDRIYDKR